LYLNTGSVALLRLEKGICPVINHIVKTATGVFWALFPIQKISATILHQILINESPRPRAEMRGIVAA
ncbi:MAG: hypothetical protein P8X50_18230, partial [Maritimibacter sp.]